MIDYLLSFLAPHLCCFCGQTGTLLCLRCKSYIQMPSCGSCLVCGQSSVSPLCLSCGRIIDNCLVVGIRQGGMQRLIGSFKFQYQRAGAVVLADLLAESLASDMPDVIIPLPTRAAHIRERGYDHTKLIARRLSRRINRPVRSVLRTSATFTQHHSGRQARLEQVKGSFMCIHPLDPTPRYVLIDDIITTGATIREAARCLRKAGARRIIVAVIARQPLDETPDIC